MMGRKGRDHFRILPLLHNHSLQVRLSGGIQEADSSSFRSADGPPATRPPYKEADTDEAPGDTDDALEVVNSSEKAANSVSPSYSRQSFSA